MEDVEWGGSPSTNPTEPLPSQHPILLPSPSQTPFLPPSLPSLNHKSVLSFFCLHFEFRRRTGTGFGYRVIIYPVRYIFDR